MRGGIPTEAATPDHLDAIFAHIDANTDQRLLAGGSVGAEFDWGRDVGLELEGWNDVDIGDGGGGCIREGGTQI